MELKLIMFVFIIAVLGIMGKVSLFAKIYVSYINIIQVKLNNYEIVKNSGQI